MWELSPSVERALISVVGLGGAFALIIVALTSNSTHFAEIIALAGPLAGAIITAWVGGSNTAAVSKQVSDTTDRASSSAAEIVRAAHVPTTVVLPTAAPGTTVTTTTAPTNGGNNATGQHDPNPGG